MAEERKRDLILESGTYAHVLDGTKGQLKTHVGPIVFNQTANDKPVRFNPKTHQIEECSLEEAKCQRIVVPEGFYAVLTNPAKDKDGKMVFPPEGRLLDTPELAIGHKEMLHGPVNFALWPGQTAQVLRGHHLKSNEYLRVKVYNVEKARTNWTSAVVQKVEGTATPPDGAEADASAAPQNTGKLVMSHAPEDLAMGKQYNILGTEVSFYMPPTGVSVVPILNEETGEKVFVREAETLEQLEYSILVDENGNKEYPRGPMVVFPRPTQRFITDQDGNRKFRAIEMNELQGVQLKFTRGVELTFANGDKKNYPAGEEVFITGKEMPLYYPEEGHQLVKYDGKPIHYAVAIPEGEARYLMNRKTGVITTIVGPTMLLPNPVIEIIVRRALGDYESALWFPGPDGKGSQEALAYNRMLRKQAENEPTTRQGVVSEGRLEAMGLSSDQMDRNLYYANSAPAFSDAARSRGAAVGSRSRAGSTMMAESRQGKSQQAMVGDVAERQSTFHEPRTLTFAGKYRGVPTIKIQPGYAVEVVNTDGSRKVVVGPKTILLEYGQSLGVLKLSTGQPKTSERLFSTAYLNTYNNRITDIIEVRTSDHVAINLKLIYNVNFEGESSKWFMIENYVKYLCDHVRSVLKGYARTVDLGYFYGDATRIVRELILGVAEKDTGKRKGMVFEANGMQITDVEVMEVVVADQAIAQALAQSQRQTVQQTLEVLRAEQDLAATRKLELLKQEKAEVQAATYSAQKELEAQALTDDLVLALKDYDARVKRVERDTEFVKKVEERNDLQAASVLARAAKSQEQEIRFAEMEQARHLAELKAQVDAIAAQMGAVSPGLIEAMQANGARETLVDVAKSLSFHTMFGAENAAEFVAKVFANSPLASLMGGVLQKAGFSGANGEGKELTAQSGQ